MGESTRRWYGARRVLGGEGCVGGVLRALGVAVALGGVLLAPTLAPAPANATTVPLQMTTPSLPSGTLDVHYSALLTATGGSPPFRFWLASGTLPKGLNVRHWMGYRPEKTTGGIVGKPKAVGTWTFTIKVVDHKKASATETLSIVIGG